VGRALEGFPRSIQKGICGECVGLKGTRKKNLHIRPTSRDYRHGFLDTLDQNTGKEEKWENQKTPTPKAYSASRPALSVGFAVPE
jgi:hypothetical protein